MATHITRMAVGWELGPFSGVGSGSTGEWGNVTAFSTVDAAAAAARTGAYGLRIHPTAATAKQSREFNLSQEFVGRFYMRYPTSLPSADSHIFYVGAGGGAETSGAQIRFRQSDSKLICVSLDAVGAVTATAVGPTISADTWYRIEFRKTDAGAFKWQVATGDGPATAFTDATASDAFNSVFFGTNTAQTFDLYIDDFVAAYSADDAGEGGAALAAEYPFGPGYVRALQPVSISSNDSSKFSASSGTLADAWQLLNDVPMLGAGSIQQDTVATTAYCEIGFEDLAASEQPNAISPPFEIRNVGGAAGYAELRAVKDGSELGPPYIYAAGWANGPALVSVVYLGGDQQTTKWTQAQVNGAAVRFGFSNDVIDPPVLGGIALMVDVSVVDPLVVGPVFDVHTSVASAKGWRKVPEVHFAIDDIHVDQDQDWALRSSAYGGYLDGSFRIPGTQAKRHPLSVDAGAPVVAFTQALDPIWEGTVAHAPRIGEDGTAEIETVGPWVEAEAAGEVLPYQVRGGRRFAEGDEDPHNYPQNDGYIGQAGAKLQWKAPKGEDFLVGQVLSFVLWIPGAHFTRYAFVINKNRDDGNFSIRVRGGVGPSGTLTTIDTYTLGAGTPSGTEKIKTGLGGDYDLLVIQLLCDTDQSALATRLRAWLTSLRINDRAPDDDMSASDVVADVGEALGWNVDGVASSAANVLPLVWEEPWSELLLYMADLEDNYVRRVTGGLQFGSWEQEWEVLRSFSGRPELRQLDVYNRVVVRYTTVAGKPAEVVVDADPDPLPGLVRVMDYDLADPQPNDVLATAIAERLMARYSQLRWAGQVVVHKARHRSGPLAILPGDVARVLDWDQAKDQALRIHGVEQRHDHVRLSIESPVSLTNLMEEARRGLGHPRRRGKNRRRGR